MFDQKVVDQKVVDQKVVDPEMFDLDRAFMSRSAQRLGLVIVLLAFVGACSAMQGVNVGSSMRLPGGIGVGANTTVGQGTPAAKKKKAEAQEKAKEKEKEEARAKEQAAQSDPAALKLYVFDCGKLSTDDVSGFGLTNEDTKVRELFVPCYLIEHPIRGRLLWDAGLDPKIAGKGEVDAGQGTRQEYAVSLVDQLAAMDLSPDDIDYVAFSHMHFDHVGSANAFANSNLLIQQTEYDAAFTNKDNPYFDYSLYAGLAEATTTLLRGDHDVFGDGSVQIISAPGHTPGHQVLFLQMANIGPLVLSGDLYHFVASRKLQAVPSFNTDADQTRKSMSKVEQLIKDKQATLWIEHNMALALALNLAPSFYD